MCAKKYYVIMTVIAATLFSVSSCHHDDEREIYLDVADIGLVDIGRIPYEFEFSTETINDNAQRCKIRTRLIKKNDQIKSIKAVVKGNDLTIDVISYPFDFECNEDSCFTVHEVNFDLIGIKKGTYNVLTRINHSEIKQF